MYLVVVALTMLVLPVASIAIEHALYSSADLIGLTGRWFVFWGVGVRLAMAGLRQLFQPGFTAHEILQTSSADVLPLVRELGVANIAAGTVALLSLAMPAFVLPSAIYAAMFYGIAGVRHVAAPDRSRNETIAMVSDLFLAAVLAIFIATRFLP